MKCNKKYKKWIWLFLYDELEDQEKDELKTHLETCEQCQKFLDEADNLYKNLERRFEIQISEQTLKESRNQLFHRIRMVKKYGRNNKWQIQLKRIFLLEFQPALRPAVVVLMLLFGIVLGKQIFNLPPQAPSNNIASFESMPLPIEKINNIYFNEDSKEVLIHYETVQEKVVRGKPDDPEIQKILARALVEDSRPNLRLRSVNALSETKSLDEKILEALIQVIEKEKNPGVKLKAIKILNSIPWDESVQHLLTKIFIKVLLAEKNPALRIQAIDGLSRIRDKKLTRVMQLAVEKDTNAYVRNKANVILQNLISDEKIKTNW